MNVSATAPRRLLPFARFAPVFAWGLRFSLRSRRFLAATGLCALVGALLGSEGSPGRIGTRRAYDAARSLSEVLDAAIFPYALPLLALVLLAQGYAREVSDRTLVYHLVRPVSRRTVFLARFASGLVAAVVATLVLVAALLATSGVGLPLGTIAAILTTAVVTVTVTGAIYYTLGAIFRFGAIAGLVYTFVVESFLAGARGTMQTLSLTYHVKSLHHRWTDDVLGEMFRNARSTTHDAVSGALSAGGVNPLLVAAERIGYEAPGRALLVLGVIAAAALAIGMVHVSRRDFALKD
jgi:hypothetical protein